VRLGNDIRDFLVLQKYLRGLGLNVAGIERAKGVESLCLWPHRPASRAFVCEPSITRRGLCEEGAGHRPGPTRHTRHSSLPQPIQARASLGGRWSARRFLSAVSAALCKPCDAGWPPVWFPTRARGGFGNGAWDPVSMHKWGSGLAFQHNGAPPLKGIAQARSNWPDRPYSFSSFLLSFSIRKNLF
jgi:hypothetical protein